MSETADRLNCDLALVKSELNKLLKRDNRVDEEIINFINSPSKHVRSRIVLLYLYANNKECTSSVVDLLASCELIHSASLLHDDVVDDAEIRRGSTTLAKKLTPHISILAGDYLVSLAVNMITNLDDKEILRNFSLCTEKMSRAEIRQYLNRGNKESCDDYLEICRDKTGCLFETVMESAAIIFGLDAPAAKRLGQLYGTLFQIKNDLEQVSADNDRKNGVYTAADVFGIEKTNVLADNYKKEMREIIVKFPDERYRNTLIRFTDSL